MFIAPATFTNPRSVRSETYNELPNLSKTLRSSGAPNTRKAGTINISLLWSENNYLSCASKIEFVKNKSSWENKHPSSVPKSPESVNGLTL